MKEKMEKELEKVDKVDQSNDNEIPDLEDADADADSDDDSDDDPYNDLDELE